jgi:WD40 repeat protein/serine/threonine protein kinase
MADKDDLSGRRIGEFVLRERIGEGSFGAVYRCDQPLLGREVVIKVLHRKLRGHDVIVQRFLREARLASRFDHPYAAHIYAFGIEPHDRLLWIAMERVQGVTLAEWLKTHGPMPLGQLVAFFERIASVVQTAHERSIVHRDLKPSNVMVIERAGELLPKLLDFGVAKLLDGLVLPETLPALYGPPLPAVEDVSGSSPAGVVRKPGKSTLPDPSAPPLGDPIGLTRDHDTVGSPPYMSPEQWGNAVTVGPASDLYALAVVAYEALTGRPLFQGETMAVLAELHRRGEVPALGGNLPVALDGMFQRALAKRPEDRWATALELAGALRAASGIGATRADLPRIDHDVRDAWLAGAPRPLAEAMAELDDAHNAYQARHIAERLAHTLVRYLVAMALALNARVHADDDDPVLLELVRALGRRALGLDERVRLLRLLVRRLSGPLGAHPVPALRELLTPEPDGTDALDPFLALTAAIDDAVPEEVVRLQLLRLIPELAKLLRMSRFVLDHVLVVPRDHAAERWTGRRRQPRMLAIVRDGELVEGHPMLLDRSGRVCLDLWPLVQAVPPAEGADPELFVFDGHGHHGALLIAGPSGLARHDAIARDWVATRVIAEIKTKTRMRDQIRVAAHEWQDRARPDGLLWRGDALADLERWMRHTTGAAVLDDLEASFVAASRSAARRSRWIRRSLVVAAAMIAPAAIKYRAVLEAHTAQQRVMQAEVTQAEVEQGRQALLHDDFAEAQLHLAAAYLRGDHSPSTVFMLARALQSRLAEQTRFASSSGRMWSAAFSPDGRQVVTTDDRNAQIWDVASHRLRFTLAHGHEVYQALYSVDGATLITAAQDAIRVWDTATGALLRELTQERLDGVSADYFSVAISPDGKLVAAIDAMGAEVHVWNAATGAALAELPSNGSGFPAIAFSSDGHWLAATGGNDVHVFATATWSASLTIAGPGIHALSWDPTTPRLVTGSTRGDAAIWEVPSGARVRTLREGGEPVDRVAFAPNGALVVTASRDGAEQVWDARSGALRSQGNYLRGKIQSVEFDATSRLVVAAGASGAVAVSDAALGMPVAILDGPRGPVRVAHFDPSSRRVVGASWDGTARVWDTSPPYLRWASPPRSDDCGLVMSLEPDRRFVAIGCRDHATQLWDTSRDRLLAELPSVTPPAGDFEPAFPAVSTAGDRAAIARGKAVEVYALPGGRLLRTIVHAADVSAVAFANTGHDLVTGAVDGSLLVTHDGQEPVALPPAAGGIDTAGFLPGGGIVAADARQHLRVFARDSASILADLETPTRIGLLRSSPDGSRLVTVPSYRVAAAPAVLWDLTSYQGISPLAGHVGHVFSARFVDGRIVTAGADGTARTWDERTGQLRQTYRGGSRLLADATLSPDGALVVAGDADGLLRFWDAATARPLWTLRAHRSFLVGIRIEGDSIVTRGFAGDVARWSLPAPAAVIEACGPAIDVADTEGQPCAIVPR